MASATACYRTRRSRIPRGNYAFWTRAVCFQLDSRPCCIVTGSTKAGTKDSRTTRCALHDLGRLGFTCHQRELLGPTDLWHHLPRAAVCGEVPQGASVVLSPGLSSDP